MRFKINVRFINRIPGSSGVFQIEIFECSDTEGAFMGYVCPVGWVGVVWDDDDDSPAGLDDAIHLGDALQRVGDMFERVAGVQDVHRRVAERQRMEVGDDVHARSRQDVNSSPAGEFVLRTADVEPYRATGIYFGIIFRQRCFK